jgi:hypothetical protein
MHTLLERCNVIQNRLMKFMQMTQYYRLNICMFTDGAGVSLSLHVPASGQRGTRGCGEPRINYRYTDHISLVVIVVYHNLYVHRSTTYVYIRAYHHM